MKRFVLSVIILISYFCIYSDDILVKTNKDTKIYMDYDQKNQIGIIQKNKTVRIEPESEAHDKDDNYWGFNLLMNEATIRVKYENIEGYINFDDLISSDNYCAKILHKFTTKILVPVSYCDSLYNMNLKYIEETDPFVLKYDERIKYLFITDVHKEWYFNYPVNYSFGNDIYFQFSAKPYRYNISGFIVGFDKKEITFVFDDLYDQLQLYPELGKYKVGKEYKIRYIIDGDYIKLFDDHSIIYSGVFIEKATYRYILYFMNNSLMMTKNDQLKDDEYLSKHDIINLVWPIHENDSCDYANEMN
jgi:hypothetical protein